MSLVSVSPFPLWFIKGATSGQSNMLLDAAGKKGAFVFQAPKTGTIDRLLFGLGIVTTSATLDVRLETVGTDGNPSGTLKGTNTNGPCSTLVSSTFREVTLTAGASVTKGDWLAIVIVNPAVSPGNLNILRWNSVTSTFPYTAAFSGTWGKACLVFPGGVRYSDGTYPYIEGILLATPTAPAFSNASTPDERGSKIIVPFNCKVSGLWFTNMSISTLGDWDAVLYDASNTVLKTISVDGDITNAATSAIQPFVVMFDTEVTLTAGDIVRAIKKPTTATTATGATVIIPSSISTNIIQSLPGGASSIYTYRTDAGSWTDDAGTAWCVGLMVSAIDDGAAGGGSSAARTIAYVG